MNSASPPASLIRSTVPRRVDVHVGDDDAGTPIRELEGGRPPDTRSAARQTATPPSIELTIRWRATGVKTPGPTLADGDRREPNPSSPTRSFRYGLPLDRPSVPDVPGDSAPARSNPRNSALVERAHPAVGGRRGDPGRDRRRSVAAGISCRPSFPSDPRPRCRRHPFSGAIPRDRTRLVDVTSTFSPQGIPSPLSRPAARLALPATPKRMTDRDRGFFDLDRWQTLYGRVDRALRLRSGFETCHIRLRGAGPRLRTSANSANPADEILRNRWNR